MLLSHHTQNRGLPEIGIIFYCAVAVQNAEFLTSAYHYGRIFYDMRINDTL